MKDFDRKGNLTLGMGQRWRREQEDSGGCIPATLQSERPQVVVKLALFLTSWCLPLVQLAALLMNLQCLKNKVIVLPIPALTPFATLFFCQLSRVTVAETRRDRERIMMACYKESATCWLIVQVEEKRKRGGGVKGGSRGPQLMEGVICES